MKRVIYSFAMVATILLAQSCTKETGSNLEVTESQGRNAKSAQSTSVMSSSCDVISFNKVQAGTLLSSITSDGGLGPIAMTSFNQRTPGQPVAAMVFDSGNPHWEDPDIATPNQVFSGPGIGIGGESGAYVNNQALGNVVVIQNFNQFGMDPNDDDGIGQITFDFSSVGKITATSITVIDVETAEEDEHGTIKLYDVKNGTLLYTATMPDTRANGVAKLSLNNTPGVGYIVVDMDGSVAIDNLEFCKEVSSTCTYTQGYWKNHPEAWPVSSLMLGSVTYNKAELQKIFTQPVQGNGLVALAHQLIAAKLNKLKGANSSVVNADIASADNMIGSLKVPPVGTGKLATSATSNLVNRLSQFNEGVIGPGHCQ